jgi:peptide/nickel transport system ATP-binding protein
VAEGSGRVVIDDISISLERGEVLALIGASGSGKTTLALTALGHMRPGLRHQAGVVELDGLNMLEAPPAQMRSIRGTKLSITHKSGASQVHEMIGLPVISRERNLPTGMDDKVFAD